MDEFKTQTKNNENLCLGTNPFLDVPLSTNAIEYKKGYVMRKCCYEANAKRSEFFPVPCYITLLDILNYKKSFHFNSYKFTY